MRFCRRRLGRAVFRESQRQVGGWRQAVQPVQPVAFGHGEGRTVLLALQGQDIVAEGQRQGWKGGGGVEIEAAQLVQAQEDAVDVGDDGVATDMHAGAVRPDPRRADVEQGPSRRIGNAVGHRPARFLQPATALVLVQGGQILHGYGVGWNLRQDAHEPVVADDRARRVVPGDDAVQRGVEAGGVARAGGGVLADEQHRHQTLMVGGQAGKGRHRRDPWWEEASEATSEATRAALT